METSNMSGIADSGVANTRRALFKPRPIKTGLPRRKCGAGSSYLVSKSGVMRLLRKPQGGRSKKYNNVTYKYVPKFRDGKRYDSQDLPLYPHRENTLTNL